MTYRLTLAGRGPAVLLDTTRSGIQDIVTTTRQALHDTINTHLAPAPDLAHVRGRVEGNNALTHFALGNTGALLADPGRLAHTIDEIVHELHAYLHWTADFDDPNSARFPELTHHDWLAWPA